MGGRGIFELQEFFFVIPVVIQFRINFPLREYIFVLRPPPHTFSNGPSPRGFLIDSL